jgi:hypothetical protein
MFSISSPELEIPTLFKEKNARSFDSAELHFVEFPLRQDDKL